MPDVQAACPKRVIQAERVRHIILSKLLTESMERVDCLQRGDAEHLGAGQGLLTTGLWDMLGVYLNSCSSLEYRRLLQGYASGTSMSQDPDHLEKRCLLILTALNSV